MRAIALLVSAVAVAGCNPFEPKLNAVCEDLIKERLRSPSTYERVRTVAQDAPIPAEAYEAGLGQSLTGAARIVIERGAVPHRHTVAIEYDASNAYGATVRETAECTYFSIDGDSSSASRYSIGLK